MKRKRIVGVTGCLPANRFSDFCQLGRRHVGRRRSVIFNSFPAVFLVWLFFGSVSASEVSTELQWRRAINTDDIDLLRELLPKVDPAISNEKGKNALMAAAKRGDFRLLDRLQSGGLDLDTVSETGGTTLMYAVLGDQRAMLEHLLLLDAEIDAQSTNGWTAVMIAAAKGFTASLTILLRAGADANLPDVYRWSPLMRAIDNRHTAAIGRLLGTANIDIEHRNENGSTALHIAVLAGDFTTVELLLQRGADVSIVDNNGQNASDLALASDNGSLLSLLQKVH